MPLSGHNVYDLTYSKELERYGLPQGNEQLPVPPLDFQGGLADLNANVIAPSLIGPGLINSNLTFTGNVTFAPTSGDTNPLSFDSPLFTTKATVQGYLETTGSAEAIRISPGTASDTGELRFLELAANGINFVGFKSPDSRAASHTYTLPSAQGIVGDCLKINTVATAITLEWGPPSKVYTLTDEATVAVNWNNGNIQTVTLGASRALTFANPVAGTKYMLFITQDNGGSRTITSWPTISWRGGAAPTLTTTGNKTDIITLVYVGTTYYGDVSLNF